MITILGLLLVLLLSAYGYIYPKLPTKHWAFKAAVIAFVLTPLIRKPYLPESFLGFLLPFTIFFIMASFLLFYITREESEHKKIRSMLFGFVFGWVMVVFSVEVVAMSYLDQWLLKNDPGIVRNNFYADAVCDSAEYYRRNFYYYVVKYELLDEATYNPIKVSAEMTANYLAEQEKILNNFTRSSTISLDSTEQKEHLESLAEIMKDYIPWKKY